jgi:hypothetical protein
MAPGITAALAKMAVGARVLFPVFSLMQRRLIDLFETSNGDEAMIVHWVLDEHLLLLHKT